MEIDRVVVVSDEVEQEEDNEEIFETKDESDRRMNRNYLRAEEAENLSLEEGRRRVEIVSSRSIGGFWSSSRSLKSIQTPLLYVSVLHPWF